MTFFSGYYVTINVKSLSHSFVSTANYKYYKYEVLTNTHCKMIIHTYKVMIDSLQECGVRLLPFVNSL